MSHRPKPELSDVHIVSKDEYRKVEGCAWDAFAGYPLFEYIGGKGHECPHASARHSHSRNLRARFLEVQKFDEKFPTSLTSRG